MTCRTCNNEATHRIDLGDGNKRPICATCLQGRNERAERQRQMRLALETARPWTAEDEARDDRNRRDL